MYAKVENGVSVKCPYSKDDLRKDNPQVSFPSTMPDEVLASFGVVSVYVTARPDLTSQQDIIQQAPVFNEQEHRWETTWTVRDKTADELAADQQQLQDQIITATQARLDDFAATRNYDGILSACTYATSSVPKFQAEGQYCVNARDLTWSALYEMLAEVQAGTRPVPTGYDDISGELPALTWPN